MAGLITELITETMNQQHHDSFPQWLLEKQQEASVELQSLKEPSRQLENWRYTDVKRLLIDSEKVINTTQRKDVVIDENTVVVTLSENGFKVSGNCPQSLTVKSIVEVDSNEWFDLKFDQETVINLLNTAAFNQGVSIECSGENDCSIVLIYDFDDLSLWQYVRNQINITKQGKLEFTEIWHNGQVNVVNVFLLGEASQLNRQQNIKHDDALNFISFNQFELASNTQVKSVNQHHGGALQHHMHLVNFNDVAAEFTMGTINKTNNNSNIADLVNVNHNFRDNQSDVTHRSIADDTSQIFTNAKAYVAVGADQSEIEQDLKNILLSPDAKIFSKPELEVYADEVVAAHGSTIGALDEQSLFYLQSRGISIKQAREIMIESFEQEAMSC